MSGALLALQANHLFDPDAKAYFARVEGPSGDNQLLEYAVKFAINNFVVGCKRDGIWNAIKASCILAGARTLAGALQPLVGTAPTNFGFLSIDYNRKTGLKGNGIDKYLNTNRLNSQDPDFSKHISVFQPESESRNVTRVALGAGSGADLGVSQLLTTTNLRFFRISRAGPTDSISDSSTSLGFWGASRISGTVTGRYNQVDYSLSQETQASGANPYFAFKRLDGANSDSRISFYSIGESLNLALLDARITTLMAALNSVIP